MSQDGNLQKLCGLCHGEHDPNDCDPYGNGTLVPDDLWGTKPCTFPIDKDKPCGQKAGAAIHREPGIMRHDYRTETSIGCIPPRKVSDERD